MSLARLLLAAPLLLSACDLGPDYAKPQATVPASFRATLATADAAWPQPGWWAGFGSPELDRLVAAARANNQDLAAAAARVVQADARAAIAGSPLLPAVNGTGGASYSRIGSARRGSVAGVTTGGTSVLSSTSTGSGTTTSTTSTTGTTVVSSTARGGSRYTDSRQFNLQAAVSYEVDFWGKNRAAYESAQFSALASRFDQETIALTVVSSVGTTYFQALGAADRLAVARRNLRDAQATLKVFQVRVQVGTGTALDVAQQEALVQTQAARIPALQSTYEQEVIALGILVGEPPSSIHITADTLTTLKTPPVAPGLPSELLMRRPDVAYAEANLAAQNGNIRAARAAFFPALQLTGTGGIESLALSTILGPGSVLFNAAANLAQTIFDNGLKQGDLDEAKGRYAELVATYRTAVLQAFTDADTYLAELRFTVEQERLSQLAVQVSQRASDIARAQLAAGTVDITTVLNTQNTLFTNQDALAQVRLAHVLALINLYKALGGGWTLTAPIGTT